MSHYIAAESLLELADESAMAARAAMAAQHDPMAVLPGLLGAVVHLLAAQVHATLAVADAQTAAARRR